MNRFRGQITEGMPVRSADGEKLGKVQSVSDGNFYIEKGFFFPKDYIASLDDIAAVRDGEIVLSVRADSLRNADDVTATGGPAVTTREQTGSNDVRVPLAEEQLDVRTREREVGSVHVRKEVVEEMKQVEVPVRREEVRVERIPASQMTTPANASNFTEEDIVVPVHEEEVEVSKRVVPRGEVRISKEQHQEERRVADSVRREEAQVEADGEIRDLTDETDPDRRS